mgnify:CR=1 FL=1
MLSSEYNVDPKGLVDEDTYANGRAVVIENGRAVIIENGTTIVDVNGRSVQTFVVNQTQTKINVSDLTSGIYFLNIETNEGSTVKKFIKN